MKPPYLLNAEEWDRAGISQLRMVLSCFNKLPPERLVSGYTFRPYHYGDEDAWLSVLARCDFGTWDESRLQRMLAGERAPLPPESIIFAVDEADRPVGVANAFMWDGDHGATVELGWVGVHPSHRGQGLAYEICRRVMCWARDQQIRPMFLKTEDFRLAAIKTYLRLGFVPQEADDGQIERWHRLRDLLETA